jgi:hypothetical protein
MEDNNMDDEERRERSRLLERTLDKIDASVRSIAESYDRALLTLSSAFLGGSLGLTNQVVDLAAVDHRWALYSAWVCFAVTIVLTLYSFVYCMDTAQPLRDAAGRFYMKQDTAAWNKSAERDRWVLRLSKAQGFFFTAGIVILGVFIAINISEGNVAESPKVVHRGIPVGSFQQPAVKPQPASNVSQQVQTETQAKPDGKPEVNSTGAPAAPAPK